MKMKKLYAFLLVITMLATLVVPTWAMETETVILTANTLSDSIKGIVEADLGKTVSADAYLSIPSVTKLDGESVGHTDFTTMAATYTSLTGDGGNGKENQWFDGVSNVPVTWSKGVWSGNTAITTGLVLDFETAHDIEGVTFWSFENDPERAAFSEDYWKSQTTPSFYRGVRISISNDGATWERVYLDDNGYVATKDTTEYRRHSDGTIDKVIHRHYCPLSETKSAQYIKIEFAGQCQFRLTELMVFGQRGSEPEPEPEPQPDPEALQILSGNAFSEADLAKIQKMSNTILSEGPASAKLTNISTDSVANDGNGELASAPKLNDGIVNGDSSSTLYSKWDGGKTPVYTIDLGGVHNVRSVLVFDKVYDPGSDASYTAEEWATKEAEAVAQQKDNHRIGNISIRVSEDGKNWSDPVYNADPRKSANANNTFIYTWNNNGKIVYDKVSHGHTCTFDLVEARYVEVSLTRSSNSIQLNELAVLGTASPVGRNIISGNYYGNATSNIPSTYKKFNINTTVIENNNISFSATNTDGKNPNTYFAQGVFGTNGTESGNNCIWQTWGAGQMEVTIDLGSIYQVSGLDMHGYVSADYQQPGAMKVEVSANGTDYNTAVNIGNLDANSFTTFDLGNSSRYYLSMTDFAPQIARYVRVTVQGQTGNRQIVPDEFMVIGDYPEDYSYVDSFTLDGAIIPGETITANAVVSATPGASQTMMLALAFYKGNLLADVKTDIKACDFNTEYTTQITVPDDVEGAFVKAFLWDENLKGSFLEKKTVDGIVDFFVDVDEDREPVILHISDPQLVDSTKQRYGGRLDSIQANYWTPDKLDENCFDYIRETVDATKPDLILITGDLIYGEFDDDGALLTKLIECMESFDIPWAPIFGNHDNESKMGADWQCAQLEAAENCLFKQRTLTGNGNYTIGIRQKNELKRVFFMLDSNACGNISEESLANGHSTSNLGFGPDQIAWYTKTAGEINEYYPDMKYSFAFHIQPKMFATAYAKYGYDDNGSNIPINIDYHEDKAEGDFGYISAKLKSEWDYDGTIVAGMKALGADSILVGHEHSNNASVVYDGIRYQYGQKCSVYDRNLYITADGKIVTSYGDEGDPIMGGTVMKLSNTDGSIDDAYIYYCDTSDDPGEGGGVYNPNK